VEDLEYPTNSPTSFTTADNSLYNEFGHFVFKDPNFEVIWKKLVHIEFPIQTTVDLIFYIFASHTFGSVLTQTLREGKKY
jgi:hypothetical protein